MLFAGRECCETADLSGVVDEDCFIQSQVGTRRHKTVQVQNLAVLPQNRVFNGIVAIGEEVSNVKTRATNDLALGIDRIGGTATIARQRAQV
jgi:hypothetical protein